MTSPSRTGELLRLAWPAICSYMLNNAPRINDQFWVQGLGGAAQAAVGATFFVQIMNFALVFLAVGGTLALVARSVGARDLPLRDSLVRHALGFGAGLGLFLTVLSYPALDWIVRGVGLSGHEGQLGHDYLSTLYLFLVPMALFPVLDSAFIGLGNTRIPLLMQVCAVSLNYVLNPLLIYGDQASGAVDAPFAASLSQLAGVLGIEPMGIRGAALATGLARTSTVVLGLCLLRAKLAAPLVVFGTGVAVRWDRVHALARIGAPMSLSIAFYAGTYWLLLKFVLSRLGTAAVAGGIGLGFQAFEGVSFPCYLGISIAASSLVGREIGARNATGALQVVRSARWLGRIAGLAFALSFWTLGGPIVQLFTQDPEVTREATRYVYVLAFSQYWVASETVNEKILLGAGFTRPILWISAFGNLLRIPLSMGLAFGLGLGPLGCWWAINISTFLKAFLLWRRVEERHWLDAAHERAA